ncbi:MAG TPA: hypothetical protein DCL61_26530 [Cyanobacteria bacterium UBA12227]|nr:hypothetical protein [Cyanobacteria bacterium UBA12227]HAX88505.1 hypothetical protein [Cyanobacteria bacterium UBA11370]HBY81485.1 hypothetical protein [Cyanobacteria bacterium UBA11148]
MKLVVRAIATFFLLTTACQLQSTTISQSQVSPISRTPEDYIGFQYNNEQELEGLEFLGASIFGGGAVKNRQGGYAYMRQGQQNMLWLTGQNKQGSQNNPTWEVLDVLTFPDYDQQLNNRTYYLGWGGKCRTENGLSNVEVVAVVVLEQKEWLDNVVQAWKINRKTGTFEPASTTNIVCENPNLG